MAFQYVQSTGCLFLPSGRLLGTGYSGFGPGKNNPAMQRIPAIGPLPVGRYEIGDAYDHQRLGPCVMNLDYRSGPGVFGRSLFRMHGDNSLHNASHGCIIMGPTIRRQVSDNDEIYLDVFAREADRLAGASWAKVSP